MKEINCKHHGLNCLIHRLEGLKDFTDCKSLSSKNLWHQGNPRIRQNHGLYGLNDYSDLKSKESIQSNNLCHLRNPRKSVIQTKSAEILNSILELI